MSNIKELAELLRRALATIPPEGISAAAEAYDEVEPELTALSSESNSAELAEAGQYGTRANAEVMAAVQACKTAREHVLNYLAEIGANSSGSNDASPRAREPSSPNTSTPCLHSAISNGPITSASSCHAM